MTSVVALVVVLVTGQTGYSDGTYGLSPGFESESVIIDYVDPEEYTIGTGDWLWVSIAGGLPFMYEDDIGAASVLNLPVTIDGNVVIPAIAAVPVAGLTLAEAKDAIVYAITYYYRGIDVSVGLSTPATFRIPVSGQVMDPGIIQISGLTRLSQALELAGGIAPAGSWTQVAILHVDYDTTLVDLTEFVAHGSLESNPLLVRSDRIHVPMAIEFVEIEGAIYLTGSSSQHDSVLSQRAILEYIPGETVSQLLMRAGGFTSNAIRGQCYIERFVDCMPVMLPAELDNIDIDPILEPNDKLVVPGSATSVAVVGSVAFPGSYPYVSGRTMLYYVAQAGGFTNEARRGGIRITLASGEELSSEEVNVIQPGSVINAPRKALVWWQDYLTVATGLATVFIAYKSLFN
jgi:protein involved in polysaccharide export with SLBB domain